MANQDGSLSKSREQSIMDESMDFTEVSGFWTGRTIFVDMMLSF